MHKLSDGDLLVFLSFRSPYYNIYLPWLTLYQKRQFMRAYASKNKGIKILKWVFLTPYVHNFSELPWWGSSAF